MEMRMEQEEDPQAFILRVERARSELAELNVELDDDDIKVQIVTGLSNEYDNERRLPDSKSKEKLTMEKIRSITAQRFEQLQQQKVDSGRIALAVMTSPASGSVKCQLCETVGHTGKVYRSSRNNFNGGGSGGAGGDRRKSDAITAALTTAVTRRR